MQVFIGGACAGKRDAVAARFPQARWIRAAELAGGAWPGLANNETLVVSGWLDDIKRRLEWQNKERREEDDALRVALIAELDALLVRERRQGIEVIVILEEVGRGIVPMAPEARRLRDLAGWLAQDAVKRAERLWYVRHGLVRQLSSGSPPG